MYKKKLRRKILAVSGSRADFGIMKGLLSGIQKDNAFDLSIVATGMHLSPSFGNTSDEIINFGFNISHKVESLLSSDTAAGISKSVGLGIIGFADVLDSINPDLVLVLGDRYEILPAVMSAMFAKKTIVHIHGGEITEGSYDESIRHAITKMSHLHFVSTEEYKCNVIQMGEDPEYVHCIGALSVEAIGSMKILRRKDIENKLEIKFKEKSLLITYHPVTRGESNPEKDIEELLKALVKLKNITLIFTLPNADNDNKIISDKINKFCLSNQNAKCFSSLGYELYLSCMFHVSGVLGNSSSGIIEAPSFNVGVINIGDRQTGRVQSKSIINSKVDSVSIAEAIDKLFSKEYQEKIKNYTNPYYSKGGSDKVIKILKEVDLKKIQNKKFNHIKND